MADRKTDPRTNEIESAISKQLAQIHTDSYGLRPSHTETIMRGDFVFVVMDVGLLQSERVVMEAGRGELVTELLDEATRWWVVVPAAAGLSTPDVYRHFDELCPVLANCGCPDDWWTIDLCFWPDAWKVTERCKKSIDELNRKYG